MPSTSPRKSSRLYPDTPLAVAGTARRELDPRLQTNLPRLSENVTDWASLPQPPLPRSANCALLPPVQLCSPQHQLRQAPHADNVSTGLVHPSLALRFTRIKSVEAAPPISSAPPSLPLLTRGLAAGDEAAFRDFHALYFNRLYQFLLVVSHGQEAEAQEALQQTFLRVLRYARVFESEDEFWSWLKAVARSAARDSGRKQRRYVGLLERFALLWRNSHQQHSAPAEHATLGAALEEELEKLAQADRRLLEAKYLEGTTVRELSAQTGLTEKAIESRLLRLRRELRQRILKQLRTL